MLFWILFFVQTSSKASFSPLDHYHAIWKYFFFCACIALQTDVRGVTSQQLMNAPTQSWCNTTEKHQPLPSILADEPIAVRETNTGRYTGAPPPRHLNCKCLLFNWILLTVSKHYIAFTSSRVRWMELHGVCSFLFCLPSSRRLYFVGADYLITISLLSKEELVAVILSQSLFAPYKPLITIL